MHVPSMKIVFSQEDDLPGFVRSMSLYESGEGKGAHLALSIVEKTETGRNYTLKQFLLKKDANGCFERANIKMESLFTLKDD